MEQRRIEMRAIGVLLAALGLAFSVAANAQDSRLETRVGEEGFESPAANIGDLDWLVGSWTGSGVGGAPASETWTAPIEGTMVGTFVQQNASGAINFTELMYISQVEGSLILRLKHFNADLTGWEEKDEVEAYRLVAIEPCAAYFQGLTIRCGDAANPSAGLVVAVRAGRDEEGQVRELVFRYWPEPGSNPSSYGCDGTTFAINQCLAGVRDRAKAREARYFAAATGTELKTRSTEQERLMQAAQIAAEQYRDQSCNAVYEQWREGSIRNAMSLRCEIRLIDERTHVIWRNWLTFQDSSAPILPEPGPTE